MAIDFPDTPSVNDTFTVGTSTWKWDGSVWNLVVYGAQGPQGTQGTQGNQGNQGSQGTQGSQGAQGAQGANGVNGDWSTAQTINAQTDNYTLASTDVGKLVTVNASTDKTVTVGTGVALSAGQRIDIIRLGTGEVTFAASSTTVNATPGLKLRAQYSSASLVCLSSNTYVLLGDLKA